MSNEPKQKVEEKIFIEGVKSVVEGETVYRRSDGKEMIVVGVTVAFIDNYGSRKVENLAFIELGK